MSYRVEELLLDDGTSPYGDWFDALGPVEAAKVTVAKLRMEQGNLSNVKWFRGIGEYKIEWGPGYRIYLAKEGKTVIILLGGGTKKRQHKDIERAIELWKWHRQRKGG